MSSSQDNILQRVKDLVKAALSSSDAAIGEDTTVASVGLLVTDKPSSSDGSRASKLGYQLADGGRLVPVGMPRPTTDAEKIALLKRAITLTAFNRAKPQKIDRDLYHEVHTQVKGRDVVTIFPLNTVSVVVPKDPSDFSDVMPGLKEEEIKMVEDASLTLDERFMREMEQQYFTPDALTPAEKAAFIRAKNARGGSEKTAAVEALRKVKSSMEEKISGGYSQSAIDPSSMPWLHNSCAEIDAGINVTARLQGGAEEEADSKLIEAAFLAGGNIIADKVNALIAALVSSGVPVGEDTTVAMVTNSSIGSRVGEPTVRPGWIKVPRDVWESVIGPGQRLSPSSAVQEDYDKWVVYNAALHPIWKDSTKNSDPSIRSDADFWRKSPATLKKEFATDIVAITAAMAAESGEQCAAVGKKYSRDVVWTKLSGDDAKKTGRNEVCIVASYAA